MTPSRLDEFVAYHDISYRAQDIDPSYPMLRYVCDRFELNTEQRYWLAFLYACTYCGPTVYYIYNEFPDFAGVNLGRLQRWWGDNRQRLVFQSDNRWIRSRNQFVEIVASYRELCSPYNGNQAETYAACVAQAERVGRDADERAALAYDACYANFSQVRYFGRFRLFLLLEAVHVVTDLPIEPTGLPLREAQSSRNGLAYALGYDHLLTGHDYGRATLNPAEFTVLSEEYERLIQTLKERLPDQRVDAWNVETTLCAYKKYHRGKRYPGYYLDRQYREILAMQNNVPHGVAWNVLWDFRREQLDAALLQELTGHDNQGVLWPHI